MSEWVWGWEGRKRRKDKDRKIDGYERKVKKEGKRKKRSRKREWWLKRKVKEVEGIKRDNERMARRENKKIKLEDR